MIGARGFEPPTARPPAGCATRLRYAPFAGQYSPRSYEARARRLLRVAFGRARVVAPRPSRQLVRDALDDFPDWLAPYLARISVQIEERPPRGEGDVYALFDGPALGDDPVGQLPPVITLFRRPLVEDFGHDPAELRREVQITVAHELAHLFGFGEERLDELGYG